MIKHYTDGRFWNERTESWEFEEDSYTAVDALLDSVEPIALREMNKLCKEQQSTINLLCDALDEAATKHKKGIWVSMRESDELIALAKQHKKA